MKRIAVVLVSVALTTGVFPDSPAAGSPSLSARQRNIVTIAALTASGDMDGLKDALNSGLDAGLTVNETGEILVQMYAYAGFPRSLNGLATFRAVLQERQSRGIKDALGREPDPLPSHVDKYDLGRENINRLTGSQSQQARPEGIGYDQAMDIFLKEHLFADIVGRNNLEFSQRELATVGALCALSGTNPQLNSHMNGAMNLGITEEQMQNITRIIAQIISAEAGENAERVLNQVKTQRKKVLPQPRTPFSAQADTAMIAIPQALFPRGTRSLGGNFTGAYWLSWLVPFDSGLKNPVASVTFEPEARTNWHAHAGGQILLVTEGRGYYQEEGKSARDLKPGDVVMIDSGVKHWHGAAPDSWFTHIAIEANPGVGGVSWLGPVSEEEYALIIQREN